MTFSIAKSYLTCSPALPGPLIPVGRTVHEALRGAAQRRHHLAPSAADHLGVGGHACGKSDVIDRNRDIAVEAQGRRKGEWRNCNRRAPPGTQRRAGENRLSLAL